ncbi:hypothetical protein KAFR_0H02910 [Kazachstania africana CBS 2517]|uniref:Chromatin modification-related protein EAF5 n=1 Tax=Kazachstania africana (strain ATCC 22294 / BCRC 22015 / CBS 2517 / CECT 1963 / NBRC 1671 / NRRL Y-8276) TaxID=1071382 RepID=H2AZE4_KAZAF|nr:hypothetical protein KAFR_0H02910 [Kazachstania africana CBS 2517]CCF59700.1 hypothetical protein KAFR_0H02910 [Kazachstania africana CBS 2517]
MEPIVAELIVLQLIYNMLLPKLTKSSDGTVQEDDLVMNNTIKLSLVKLTNEIQNNIIVNRIDEYTKLNINDILKIIKELFPLQRIIVVDGQLSFQNLKIVEIKKLILDKYETFKTKQIEAITELEDKILSEDTTTTASQPHIQTKATTIKKNVDPRREKLLQLYRDTVLNKLQHKNKILDKLYENFNENSSKIVNELLNLDQIKTTTPVSVHNLQLILQKSISDGIMCNVAYSPQWQIARKSQTELNDTVEFMRRALE